MYKSTKSRSPKATLLFVTVVGILISLIVTLFNVENPTFNSYITDIDYYDNKLVIGDGDGTIVLYDLETKSSVHLSPEPQYDGLVGVQFVPNSTLIVAVYSRHRIIIFDTTEVTEYDIYDLKDYYDILSLAVSSDGQNIAIGGWGFIALYHIYNNQISDNYREEFIPDDCPVCSRIHGIWDLSFSADSKHIVTFDTDAKVYIWDVKTLAASPLFSEDNHGNLFVAGSVDYAPTSNELILTSCATDTKINVWNVNTQQEILSINEQDIFAHDIAYIDSGNALIATFSDGSIRVYDIRTGDVLKILAGNGVRILKVEIIAERYAVLGYHDGDVQVMDIEHDFTMMSFDTFFENY